MNYFNDDQSFSAYRQQGSWVCFPVQEGSQNQGGLEGQINMSDGSQQPVVCYPSQPQAEGQGQGGNSQGQSGGQEQQGGGENEGQQQGGQDQEGMPPPQDILGQFGQGGNEGQQQEGQGQGGTPTPQDILGQFGQGGNQGQQQEGQGQGGMPTPQDILGQLGQGGNQGQQQRAQSQGGGIPMYPGMFGFVNVCQGGRSGMRGMPMCPETQRKWGHPQVVMPHAIWFPVNYGYYW